MADSALLVHNKVFFFVKKDTFCIQERYFLDKNGMFLVSERIFFLLGMVFCCSEFVFFGQKGDSLGQRKYFLAENFIFLG